MPDFALGAPRLTDSRYTVSIIDHRGKRRAVSIPMSPLATATQLTAVRTAIGQATNGAVVETATTSTEFITNIAHPNVRTFDESYSTVDHVAVLIYQDNNGDTVSIEIPAPDLSLFAPDGETINPTNARVTAINTAVLAALNQGDSSLTPPGPDGTFAYVRGYLSTRASDRRRPRVRPGGGVMEPTSTQLPPPEPGV